MTPSGGAATISGVVYQALWYLLRAFELHVSRPSKEDSGEALLVLEPTGGGGDLCVISSDGEVAQVDQTKSKSDGGTWSLQRVIKDVFPDLFLAVRVDCPDAEYRFVTEGKMGRWKVWLPVFHSLKNLANTSDIVAALDNEHRLKVGSNKSKSGKTSQSLFTQDAYTSREMFLLIKGELANVPRIRALRLSEFDFRIRLVALLGGFVFVPSRAKRSLLRKINKKLLEYVDVEDDIDQIRDHLAMTLMRLASDGHQVIRPSDLLQECSLTAIPLSDWEGLHRKACGELESKLINRKYSKTDDIRFNSSEKIVEDWLKFRQVLLVSGESGQGKTWKLASMALHVSKTRSLVLWVDATGNAGTDAQVAADQLWLDIRGGERSTRLRQVAKRIKRSAPSDEPTRIVIFIDNVQSAEEARALVRDRNDWASHGIAIAMTCPQRISDDLSSEFPERVLSVPTQDFSWEELHQYLSQFGAELMSHVPDDIKETLRRPLLAAIYRDMADNTWNPTSEYAIYSRVWLRLSTHDQTRFPLDATRLETLALSLMTGAPYPWTNTQLLAVGLDNDAIGRLTRCGWIVSSQAGWRIFHDRLLNWAVAQGLYESIRSRRNSVEQVFERIAEYERSNPQNWLGYVHMDFLWLISDDSTVEVNSVARYLELHEQNFHYQHEYLYGAHVCTLGKQILPALTLRFREYSGFSNVLTTLAQSIASLLGQQTKDLIEGLLRSSDRLLQRKGFILLSIDPQPELCDLMWEAYKQMTASPTLYLLHQENSAEFVRNEMWNTLCKSVKLNPDWLNKTLQDASITPDLLADLGWVVVESVNGSQVWNSCKVILMSGLEERQPNVIASCIRKFRDQSCTDWLELQVINDGIASLESFRALIRIQSERREIPIPNVRTPYARHVGYWAFGEYWIRNLDQLEQAINCWLRSGNDSFQVAATMNGFLNEIPIDFFRRLLDDLHTSLGQRLQEYSAPNNGSSLEFSVFRSFVASRFQDELKGLRGSRLESMLVEFLRRLGPQIGFAGHEHDRDNLLQLLRRINPARMIEVVAEYMHTDDEFGRRHAVAWAMKVPNQAVCQIARKWVLEEKLGNSGQLTESQRRALQLLLLNRRFQDVADGLCRLGVNSLDLGTARQFIGEERDFDWLGELHDRVFKTPTDGNIAALGLFGNEKHITTIHQVLQISGDNKQLIRACIVGMLLNDDRTEIGIDLAIQHYAVESHWAQSLLLESRSDQALLFLFQKLNEEFDCVLALNLLKRSAYVEQILSLANAKLFDAVQYIGWQDLHYLLSNLNPDIRERMLADQTLRDFLIRESFVEDDSVRFGSRNDLIRCLALFDRDKAILAAKKRLKSEHTRSRELAPMLLMELDSDGSPSLLICQLQNLDAKEDEKVWNAIGLAIQYSPISNAVNSMFGSSDAKERKAACFIAGWSHLDFEKQLKVCLDDDDDHVAATAVSAIKRVRRRRVEKEVEEMIDQTTDLAEKWCLIDDLVDTMDRVDTNEPIPKSLRQVFRDLPVIIYKVSRQRLADTRKFNA